MYRKQKKAESLHFSFVCGAGGGTRTHTPLRITDFESVSSASSDTPAIHLFNRSLISVPFLVYICNKHL